MDLISNWEETKEKINKLIIFERDARNQTIRLNGMPEILKKEKDPLLEKFMEVASKLGEEVLGTLFNTNNIDELPVEFKNHDHFAELKFTDTGLFEVVHRLLEAIFKGNVVRDMLQGKRVAMDNLLRELQQYRH